MLLNKPNAGTRWKIRPDGADKVTGKCIYLTDMHKPGMLYGKILRSRHAHARVLFIRTEEAERLPGVHAVITYRDVPGMNRFGIAIPDQPVLCEDRVRYIGDALVAVAADSLEIAEQALRMIEVGYEPLPVLDNPEAALRPDAPKLHPSGNVLHRTSYRRGEVSEAFTRCAHVVEHTYYTPRQMHTYMETEGGLFVPGEDGRLTVYAPTQHGYKDRMQLSRILAMPESGIRVVSSPIGGSFGGKDELNIQPFGALLALKSGRPVKIHQERFESVRAGLKRHPMKITMRTGVDGEGRLAAHQVRMIADTGAYATLGPAVLNFATEHTMGPYRIPNVDVEGLSVYTNNGVSGEFRGFGGNQVIYALEAQMDRLAEKLGMDPWELRRINLRKADDPGPMEQKIVATEGAGQVWASVEQSDVWRRRKANAKDDRVPWIRRGVGAAIAMHGSGLGFGLPDFGGGRLSLNPEGKIEAAFGYEEFGQGLLGTLEIMLTEHFGCLAEDLSLVIGDTGRVPHSGSSTASRTTTMMWLALQKMKPVFIGKLLSEASAILNIHPSELETGPGGIWRRQALGSESDRHSPVITYRELAEKAAKPIETLSQIHFPTTPDAVMGGHFLYTYAGAAVEVEVNTLTGRVRIVDQYHAVAAGPVVNPMGYAGQIEGGSSMAIGFTLMEDAVMSSGHYVTRNLDTYLIPTVYDMPGRFSLDAIEELPEDDPYGPRGVGEIGTVALAPAIISAVRQAVGVWVEKLPISPEQLIGNADFLNGA
ncbi:xanthine dehydrogenase subunit D [Paenibacillus sp. JMULE4]|uniref:xanthine dehydrogenase subunit D n=1 Tax=Paenibacillus sp. JMULE4 TaxID=2518342 RepID=UPI0015760F3D|nr:xanthine dehydrogenase subunit D [Paenibacillus sp. JMULE4]NTZ16775.1 xanthine dehydrogenase subunit D [Paenibacillus sp. JMULE4]